MPSGRPALDRRRMGLEFFVDYANAEAALDNALCVARDAIEGSARCLASAGEGRLTLIFGCGDARDRGKRTSMGCVAVGCTDVAMVTSHDPRGEDPERIVAEICAGLESEAGRAEVHVEPGRPTRRARRRCSCACRAR